MPVCSPHGGRVGAGGIDCACRKRAGEERTREVASCQHEERVFAHTLKMSMVDRHGMI